MQLLLLGLYAATSIAYAWHFVRRHAIAGRVATVTLGATALIHTFVIGMQTMQAGQVPVTGSTEALFVFAWLLGIAYLYAELTTEERSMGVFIAPLLVALLIIPAARGIDSQPPSAALQSPWFAFHVASLLFSYASFALAGIVGVTFVLLFRELKKRQPGYFFARLPPLQTLDAMNRRAIVIGWLFLTAGILVGALWATEIRADAVTDPQTPTMSFFDAKIVTSLLVWLLYSFQLYSRRAFGWHGRRAAWLSVAGFGAVLLNLLPVGYFLSRTHSF